MKKSAGKRPAIPSQPARNVTPVTPPDTSALDGQIAFARSGGMPIDDLITRTHALTQRGLAADSAALYEAWIASTVPQL
jgi:hypothetical protein